MYLTLTTRCNMACDHCCYSCNPDTGKHMTLDNALHALRFIAEQDNCTVALGGGEPTLHPNFLTILEEALSLFDSVWLATNGSQTDTMWRLANIINNEDHESFLVEDYDDYDDMYDNAPMIFQENKLEVTLSTDYFHDQDLISSDIWNYWHDRTREKRHGFSLRDVTQTKDGLANAGQAKVNNLTDSNHCPCSTIMITVEGGIKPCGCESAPVMGDIFHRFPTDLTKLLNNEDFQQTNCYNGGKNADI